MNLKTVILLLACACLIACKKKHTDPGTTTTSTTTDISAYKGTGSVTQGKGTTTTVNLFPGCQGSRTSVLGTITSTDNKTWTVPAETNFTTTSFPFASDLNNICAGHNYTTDAQAVAALNPANVVTIDADGSIVTAYIYADNYFEMYVNGVPVGKDPVPYTPFNSSIIQFKVKKPYTIAVKLVDWEENPGLGSENNGEAYHPGDGGFVAVFKNSTGGIDEVTSSSWKAQTFYTAPIKDLGCLVETGTSRTSAGCSTTGVADGSKFYGIHWALPADWFSKTFDDSGWPQATVFTNNTVGVGNQTAYTNFTNIFDDPSKDAAFIWSSSLILDNLVVVRQTVR